MSDHLLLVTADDFGIGPATSRGILELATRGVVTSTVLLVNSPYAEWAVQQWVAAGRPVELGWHPCLTLDAPVLPPQQVASLVAESGRFLSLGRFLHRSLLGQVNPAEVEAEFRAQLQRFHDLVGHPPANVNAHHHLHIFPGIAAALQRVLADLSPRPFVRRVVEPLPTLWRIPGGRLKRTVLRLLGQQAARQYHGFAGNDCLLGLSDWQQLPGPTFFDRWLLAARGSVAELCCHPGYPDATLRGRDPDPLHRRQRERDLLAAPEFLAGVKRAGFRLATAAQVRSACPQPWAGRSKARSHSGSLAANSSALAARRVT